MAFEFLRSENSASPIEKEIVAANGTTYEHGCLLKYGSDGTAEKTTGKPEFVYAGKDITAKTGDKLACIVSFPEYEWETMLSASGSSLKVGNKVTTDGTKVRQLQRSALRRIRCYQLWSLLVRKKCRMK